MPCDQLEWESGDSEVFTHCSRFVRDCGYVFFFTAYER